MPDKNGRLTTEEIVELIRQGESVEVEVTPDHSGTVFWFSRHAITVDPGIKELVLSPDKADQIGQAFTAWAETKEES
jgi:hypothetical protein